MATNAVSIFNDVIGPVMRGPSSSHCAAALRIGRLARDLMQGCIGSVLVEYSAGGSLATTHESQGSDMGLFGGLMGWDAADGRLPESDRLIAEAGIEVDTAITDEDFPHPNTYRLTLRNPRGTHVVTAVSTGGGMIEVIRIDGWDVSICGDCYETLVIVAGRGDELRAVLMQHSEAADGRVHESPDGQLVELRTREAVAPDRLASLARPFNARSISTLAPVLPVLSGGDADLPFRTCDEMLAFDAERHLAFWELAACYESVRGGVSADRVVARMTDIVRTLRVSVRDGVRGTDYGDRILGHQCGVFRDRMDNGALLDGGALNRILLYVTALMEVKSSMGVIVAAPTAGACAALPAACLGYSDTLGLGDDDVAKAMLAGGVVGMFIASRSTFAAEVAGCQAECGAASGMAAAALVSLAGGTVNQGVAAASMALQNSLGMVCDPVASRVEVPCLGKNAMAAANAFACANMALADYDPVIPLDEVIETMDRVGRSLPRELRCTALGGLSITPTSHAVEQRLARGRR